MRHIRGLSLFSVLAYGVPASSQTPNVAITSALHPGRIPRISLNLTTNVTQRQYSVKDPYDVNPAGSDLIIEFYGYRDFLPRHRVIRVIENAEMVAATFMGEDHIGSEPIQSWVDNLQLMLIPEMEMTWRDWSTVLRGMRLTAEDEQMFFEWSFVILKNETAEGVIGHGILNDVTRQTVGTSK